MTNFFNRLLVLLKLGTYQFGAQIVTEEQLKEGKRQLQRYKKNTKSFYRRSAFRTIIASLSDGKDGGPASFFSKIIGGSGGSKKRGTGGPRGAGGDVELSIHEPPALSGMVEKKTGSALYVL